MNQLDKGYQTLLNKIITKGTKKADRTGTGTYSLFSEEIRHDMSEGFPLLTTKKMYTKGIITELIWFLRGDTNIKFLVDNDCHIWNGDAYKNYETAFKKGLASGFSKMMKNIPDEIIDKETFVDLIKNSDTYESHEFVEKWGELGPIYGKQWRHWSVFKGINPETGEFFLGNEWIDQIYNLIRDLKTNPDSRRLMVNAWNVADIDAAVLPPCHYGFQCWTRELTLEERSLIAKSNHYEVSINIKSIGIDEDHTLHEHLDKLNIPKRAISLKWNQRSVDTFLGLPFNIASYGLLLEILAKMVNMIPEELIGSLGDTHLYSNHIDQAKEQIGRDSFDLPSIEINTDSWGLDKILDDLDGVINNIKISDFTIKDYKSHSTIKAELSN